MRASRIALVVILIVVVAIVLYGAHLVHRGFGANTQPSWLEVALARAARNLSIPAIAKDAANPIPPTAENLTEGREHFADHCAACHANNGSGQTEMGQNLDPKAPDMRSPLTQNLTDGEIFYVIQNGVRLTGMPAWSSSHQAPDTWKLVLFIRHLPQLTAEEESDMERFNPKSDADRQEEQEEQEFLNNGTVPASSGNKHHHH
jgi:mono/diheme cytochrome c family protein